MRSAYIESSEILFLFDHEPFVLMVQGLKVVLQVFIGLKVDVDEAGLEVLKEGCYYVTERDQSK